jgi:hypothetical protein
MFVTSLLRVLQAQSQNVTVCKTLAELDQTQCEKRTLSDVFYK